MTTSTIKPAFIIQFDLTLAEHRFSIDLSLPTKGVIGVFGESGSGKTTLLRVISGLQPIKNGTIYFNHHFWQEQESTLPVYKRPIGYVFQEASLFPHLTIKGNLEFAKKRAWPSNNQAQTLNTDTIHRLLNMDALLHKWPSQLSGGERQRVAIARALMINPSLLLMDEPLSALDYDRKQEILSYLEKLKKELSIPIIYVSHSASELSRLADYLVIINKGSVHTHGEINQVLTQPHLPSCLQQDVGVILQTYVQQKSPSDALQAVSFSMNNVNTPLWVKHTNALIGEVLRVQIFAKDVSITLSKSIDTSITNILPAEILSIQEDADHMILITLKVENTQILAKITQRSCENLALQAGQMVWAQIKAIAVIA